MSEELNEDKVPLPWNPNEQCELDKKRVATRLSKYPEEEIAGNLFDRECDDLDNTIVKRKDRFIDCVDIPDVPKAKLLKEDWPIVPFPGVPEVEIPKRLMAHLLSCCLKDRTAGFDFDITQELDSNNDKAQMSNVSAATTTLTIQLGDTVSTTTSYLVIGFNATPELCFCDENCGDEDYIHIKINLDAQYYEHQKPIDYDILITDDQLENFISDHGGGGGGNPLCAQKLFGQYLGSDVVLDDPDSFSGSFIPYGSYSSLSNNAITAYAAPYLTNFKLIHSGVYKLEYFCEYDKWYITDGQCADVAPRYPFPSYVLVKKSGLPNQTYSGTVVFYTDTMTYPYDDWEKVYDSTDSTLLEAEAFVNGELTLAPISGNLAQFSFSFVLEEGAVGTVVYNIFMYYNEGSCAERAFKLIFDLKDTTVEETIEEEGE